MSLTVEEIEKQLEQGNTQPGELAEFRVILSGKFARATNELEEVLLKKPRIWNELRQTVKSDTQAERLWEATEMGVAERHWRFTLKKIEKMMSAISTMITVKSDEARNLY